MNNFVQLVQKEKGKIRKNESYDVTEFVYKITPKRLEIKRAYSLWDRIFNFRKVADKIEKECIEETRDYMEWKINDLIKKDNLGRKK